jgi:septal ring factor EnvC (AmiA/AmiB activator)
MMSNENNPVGAVMAPQSSQNGRFVNVKAIAERILMSVPLDDKDYPVYVMNNGEISIKKLPEQYAVNIYVKDVDGRYNFTIDEAMKNINDEIIKAINDIVGRVETEKITIAIEVYNSNDFLGESNEILYKYVGTKYRIRDQKQAWAIAFSYEKRFKAKYPNLAQQVSVKADVGGSYWPKLIVKLATPSDKFMQLLNQVFNPQVKSRIEQIDEKITELKAEIKRLEEEIKRLEAEKEKLKSIPISESRIASVMKEVIKNAA